MDRMRKPFEFISTTEKISSLFCCTADYAAKVVKDWCDKLPIYEAIPNSTNHDFLIAMLY
jgi:hypothetical protein